MPVPFILQLSGSMIPGLILALIWLTAALVVGLKTVFKPAMRLDIARLIVGKGIYAAVALIVLMAVAAII